MDIKRRSLLARDEDQEPEKDQVSERPLTASLFDALFGGGKKK